MVKALRKRVPTAAKKEKASSPVAVDKESLLASAGGDHVKSSKKVD